MGQLTENIVNFFRVFYSFPFVFEIFCIAFSAILCRGNYSKSIRKIIFDFLNFAILFASITILCMLSYSLNQPRFTPYLIILSMVIPGFIYLGITDKLSFRKKFVRMILFFSATYVVTEIGHHNNLILAKLSLNSFAYQALMSLPYLLAIISGFLIGYININNFYCIPISYLILDISIFLGILIISMVQSNFDISSSTAYHAFIIFVLFVLLAIDIGIYVFLYLLLRSQQRTIQAEAEAKMNQSALLMLKMNQDSITRSSMARHDIKNHYAYAINLLKEKQYDKAEEYLQKTLDVTFEDIHIIDCGNSVVSSILNLEMTKAHMRHIEMMTMVAIPPSLPFLDSDLCSLLTNLIDNALEETERTPDKKPCIDVRIRADKNYLRFLICNPTDKQRLEFNSSKNTNGHGYGIGIIKGMIRKYNGHITFYIEDGKFYSDGIIEMFQKQGENHD